MELTPHDISLAFACAFAFLKGRVEAGAKSAIEDGVSELLKKTFHHLRNRVKGSDDAEQALKKVEKEATSKDAWQALSEVVPDILTDPRMVQHITRLREIIPANDQSMHFEGSSFAASTIFGSGTTLNNPTFTFPTAEPARSEPPQPDYLLPYRKHLFQWARRQVFLDGNENNATSVALNEIYVDLDVTSGSDTVQLAAAGHKRDGGSGDEVELPRKLIAAVAAQRQVVVLGEPGGGKSTFLAHLVQCLCGPFVAPDIDWKKELKDWPTDEVALVPIHVPLPALAAWLEKKNILEPGSEDLWKFLAHSLKKYGLANALDIIKDGMTTVPAWKKAPATFLLDGLDELSLSKRALVHKAVKALQDPYCNARIVVTCRTVAYDEREWHLPGILSIQIVQLSSELIAEFNEKWHTHLNEVHPGQKAHYEDLRDNFAKELKRDDLSRMATNPLLLTVMAIIHTVDGTLPESRTLVYDRAVNLLIVEWDAMKGETESGVPSPNLMRDLMSRVGVDIETMKQAVGELAYMAHQDKCCLKNVAAVGGITKEQLVKVLELLDSRPFDEWSDRETPTAWAQKVVVALKKRAGLLVLTEQKEGHFTFPHRTFQEYLAGIYLSRSHESLKEAARLAGEHDIWRLPVVLAAGYLGRCRQNNDRVRALLAELLERAKAQDEAGWRRVWIAGEALLEAGLANVGAGAIGQMLVKDIRVNLAALITGGYLTASQRSAAGNALAKIGDSRPGVGLVPDTDLPDLEFCFVPGGRFMMGDDSSPHDDERPQHPVDVVDRDYWIGHYPVTVAQFKAFWQASDRQAWLSKLKDERALEGIANHPVRYVTWHEARAFCQWFTARWRAGVEGLPNLPDGWEVRLPSEAEWEKAARGGERVPRKSEIRPVGIKALRPDATPATAGWIENDGMVRCYPWGDNEPDSARCNYHEVEIDGGETSPVGCFPAGRSPIGCHDLAGNVWEWTHSLFDEERFPYPYHEGYPQREDETADGYRVLRGGAFNYNSDFLRCAYRSSRRVPVLSHYGIGFRIVVAPGSAASEPLTSEG